jgi:para-nitrobenzyl esterase
MDVPFTFDVVDRTGTDLLVGEIRDDTRALARNMRQAWTTFARTGRPAAPELPAWPNYTLDRRATMELGSTFRVLDDPGSAARRAWAAAT